MYKPYLYTILLLTISLNASTQTILCITSTPNKTFCQENNTIILNDINNIKESIFTIQSAIREKIDNKEQPILIAENHDATLLTIAQANLLPYYRKNIRGLVLKEPKEIDLKEMDWYWSKSLVMDSNQNHREVFKKAFEKNGIEYKFVASDTSLELDKWFPKELKCKVESQKLLKNPNYYGAILHHGFAKILYNSKSKLIHKSSDYGFDKQQEYDVFYKKNSKKNRLFIYIHGGNWKSGNKEDYFALCKQYADRGYTSFSVNYRLLDLPKVGIKEMVQDVKEAIENIVENAKEYNGDKNNTVLMADSVGAMLSYMAVTRLKKEYQPERVVFHALATNLALFSKEKQILLSGIEDENNRTQWNKKFSPLSPKNLQDYTPSTLIIQSLEDHITVPKHLEELEIQSVIHNNNIQSLWLEDTLESKHQDIALKIDNFLQ